jgi:hypoxanthine-guanine phosphoribosyltransferase
MVGMVGRNCTVLATIIKAGITILQVRRNLEIQSSESLQIYTKLNQIIRSDSESKLMNTFIGLIDGGLK